MEIFIAHVYKRLELAAINICRIYLQSIHLSDMTTGDGKHICTILYEGSYNRCVQTNINGPPKGNLVVQIGQHGNEKLNQTFTSSTLN